MSAMPSRSWDISLHQPNLLRELRDYGPSDASELISLLVQA